MSAYPNNVIQNNPWWTVEYTYRPGGVAALYGFRHGGGNSVPPQTQPYQRLYAMIPGKQLTKQTPPSQSSSVDCEASVGRWLGNK